MSDIDDDAHWPVAAARAADAKHGEDVVVLEVGPVLSLCGHFVICSAGNTRLHWASVQPPARMFSSARHGLETVL